MVQPQLQWMLMSVLVHSHAGNSGVDSSDRCAEMGGEELLAGTIVAPDAMAMQHSPMSIVARQLR